MAKEKVDAIYFKLSEPERRGIEERMKSAGVENMSAYIRKMCLDGYILRLDLPQIKECSRYLSSASNNLNQIARRVNSGGTYSDPELKDVKQSLDNCSDLFKEVLEQLARIN